MSYINRDYDSTSCDEKIYFTVDCYDKILNYLIHTQELSMQQIRYITKIQYNLWNNINIENNMKKLLDFIHDHIE